MTIIELFLIAVGLACDAFVVIDTTKASQARPTAIKNSSIIVILYFIYFFTFDNSH